MTLAYNVHKTAHVEPDLKKGDNVWIGPGVVVGEHVVIGDNVQVWPNSYIGHDTVLEDDVIICPAVALAGHTRVMRGAYVGINATTHQYVTIGAYVCVGAGAVVLRDVPPGLTVVGVPAKLIGANTRGLDRAGVQYDDDLKDEFIEWREKAGRR